MKRDLKKIALFAEIVGGTGIIISVLYLAYQVSQNTANIQAANALSISSEITALRQPSIENAELNDLIRKGRSDSDALTDGERRRFFSHALNRFAILENILFMEGEGLLPEGFAPPLINGFCGSLNGPGYRVIWEESAKPFFSTRLRTYLEKCFSD
jgi:hypothetical protein